jgi:magnesium-transporting ATPase (P-type)
MVQRHAFSKKEREEIQKAREIFLNQLVASVVILALILWVGVLFRSYWVIAFLVILIVVMYVSFVPKKKFR